MQHIFLSFGCALHVDGRCGKVGSVHKQSPEASIAFCKLRVIRKESGKRIQAWFWPPPQLTQAWWLDKPGRRKIYIGEYGKDSEAGPFYVASPEPLPNVRKPFMEQEKSGFTFPKTFLLPEEQPGQQVTLGALSRGGLSRHILFARTETLGRRIVGGKLERGPVAPEMLGAFLLRAYAFESHADVIKKAFPELL